MSYIVRNSKKKVTQKNGLLTSNKLNASLQDNKLYHESDKQDNLYLKYLSMLNHPVYYHTKKSSIANDYTNSTQNCGYGANLSHRKKTRGMKTHQEVLNTKPGVFAGVNY